jgi:hypothetical protein
MKNILIILFITLFCLFFNNKSFAFSEAQECVRWVLGGPLDKQLRSAKTNEERVIIMENYKKKAPLDFAKKLDACQTLFPDVSNSKNLKGPYPTHAACCSCSGGCIALWVLFAYCNTCISIQGGAYCCSTCGIPGPPGGSCQ